MKETIFKPKKRFSNWFQIRWKEAMGKPECPYLYRWTLIIFGFSIRLHHWIKSDDRRYFHDHSCNLISIILRGQYYNVTAAGKFLAEAWHPRYMDAKVRHYLDIPEGGAWTLLFCGRPYHKWGFYVPREDTGEVRRMRPYKYFKRFGIIQDENYQ